MILWVRSERKRVSLKSDRGLEEAKHHHESFFDEKFTFVVTGPESPPTSSMPMNTTQPLSIGQKKRRSALQSLRGDLARYVRNPPYVDRKVGLATPTSPDFIQEIPTSVSSKPGGLLSAISTSQRSSLPLASFAAAEAKQPADRDALTQPFPQQGSHDLANSGSRSRSNSLSSDEINHILEMATMFTPANNRELGPMETALGGEYEKAHSTVGTGRSRFSGLTAQRDLRIPSSPGSSDVRGSGEHTSSYLRARSRWVDSLLRTYEGTAFANRTSMSSPTTKWGNPNLATPSTATYRDPPHAHVPSSPFPTTPLPPSRSSYPLSPARTEMLTNAIAGPSSAPMEGEQTLEIPSIVRPSAPLQKPPASRIAFNRRRPSRS